MLHLNRIFFVLLIFSFYQGIAQKTNRKIIWYYNYFYGGDTLIFGKVYQDASGNPLKFERFQFYTSNISVLQKDGDTLKINDSYVLSSGTDGGHDLGTHLVGAPESVIFQLGVDSQANHSDPSTYAENHALYHKIPSMHWGWETGYRFWVIEGWIDDDRDGKFTNRFEFHIVGDPLLKTKKLTNQGIIKDEKLFLVTNVDLKLLLNGIDLTQNNVFHGGPWDHGSGPIIKIANNSVTTNAFSTGSGFNLSATSPAFPAISIYPNPAHNGQFHFKSEDGPVTVKLSNSTGTNMAEYYSETGDLNISGLFPGCYFLRAYFKDGRSAVYKVVAP